jgi:excisionase family DNA binding protein
MPVTADECQTLTIEEAAARLGIGRTLCYQLIRAGQIPVIRLGRRVLVSRSALDRMLAEAGSWQPGGRDATP